MCGELSSVVVVCSTLLSQVNEMPDQYLFKMISTKNVVLSYVASSVLKEGLLICSFGFDALNIIYVHLTNLKKINKF